MDPAAVPPVDSGDSGVEDDVEPGGDDERRLGAPARGPAVGEGSGDDDTGASQQ